MGNRGLTLIEIMIVLAIAAVLMFALAANFRGWQGAYRVERQTKEIYVDMMNTVSRAMQRNRMHYVNFITATSYSVIDDTDPAPDGDGNLMPADTVIPTFPKTLEYAVQVGAAGGFPSRFDINRRGLNEDPNTICIFTDLDGDGSSDFDPDYDCIVISRTRINMGQLTTQVPANCNANSCDTK